MRYIVFDMNTGEILRSGQCPDGMHSAQARYGELAMEGEANEHTQYINTSDYSITQRPEFQIHVSAVNIQADLVDSMSITAVPADTSISVIGPVNAECVITDGVFQMLCAEPGVYTVRLRKFPYQDKEIVVYAS